MNLGALTSIIEVGIGLNLAFGVVRQFRERLVSHLKSTASKQSGKFQAELQNALAMMSAPGNGKVPEAVTKAEAMAESFEEFSKQFQDRGVVWAITSTIVLLLALPYLVLHGSDECGVFWVVGLEIVAVGPVATWCAILLAHFAGFRIGLWWIGREHNRDLTAYRKVANRSTPETEQRLVLENLPQWIHIGSPTVTPRERWHATASHDNEGKDPPGNALRPDMVSRWSTGQKQDGTESFTVDLGDISRVSTIRMHCGVTGTDYPRRYEVHVANAPNAPSHVVATGSGDPQDPLTVVNFGSPVVGRVFTIRQTAHGDRWWSIHRLEVA